ncbi:unnamed protein product [Vitrella brassicaformis CCMP3155]|uniref:Uncharacterized protein n=1 Tax=Vitrella brassicaformis (strain CCMP3155) TaxID=1169540 RepID=A0A0G4F369_VITBC|nr:unnamed protein product [Vitrella brassicaformis CCMP3155]|eukprot:CEM06499.1 unnamed protein product [Vitrella brassicaformis CCMP3155]
MVGESASATSPPPHLPAQGELVIVELRPTEEASHGLPRRLLDANREWPNNATGKRNEEMWKGSRLYRIVNCGDKDDAGCTWDKATAENQTLIIIGREEDCEHVRGFYKGGFPLRIPDEVNLDRLRQQLVTDWGIAVEKDEMISTQRACREAVGEGVAVVVGLSFVGIAATLFVEWASGTPLLSAWPFGDQWPLATVFGAVWGAFFFQWWYWQALHAFFTRDCWSRCCSRSGSGDSSSPQHRSLEMAATEVQHHTDEDEDEDGHEHGGGGGGVGAS